MNKKGFTLVELSIVLVIIGLLVGGILASQSMVSTTKIQKTVRQLQQYEVAVTNFRTKYKQLPGDADVFTGPSGALNSGYISDGGWFSETGKFWSDLSTGVGLKDAKGQDFQTFGTSGDTEFETKIPQLSIDHNRGLKTGLFVETTDVGFGPKNYWLYWSFNGSDWMSGPAASALKPKDMVAIDRKIDDGLAASGKMINYDWSWGANPCVVGGVYNIGNNNYLCSLVLEVGFNGS